MKKQDLSSEIDDVVDPVVRRAIHAMRAPSPAAAVARRVVVEGAGAPASAGGRVVGASWPRRGTVPWHRADDDRQVA